MCINRNIQLTPNSPIQLNYGLKIMSHFDTRVYRTELNYVDNIVNLNYASQNKTYFSYNFK